jgi:alkylation response protein AidB-like acyl-CoA dehydrogenase
LPADRVDLLVVLDVEGAVVLERGFELTRLRGAGLRAAGAAELHLAGAPIAARWRGRAEAARALGRARLYTASLLLGVLRQAADFSRAYALERVAFGKPIAHHQALAFLIADMRSAVDGARLLVHEAAWHAERGLEFEALAASAYAEAIEASRFIGPNGVQILGGHGFMQDYPVEKYMREARALGLGLGGIDAAREDAGRALCAQPGPVALSHLEGSAWNS